MASKMTINRWGHQEWRNEAGELHRENGPAYIGSVSQEWWRNGQLHRENGPARIALYGEGCIEEWYFNNKFHRDNGPAVIHPPSFSYPNGDQSWWRHGRFIRSGTYTKPNLNWKRYGF